MITLYGSGARFGLPDASPFVSKAEILLKMAGVPYQKAKANFSKAPKGKIPYIEADGKLIGDSFFIRHYLEEKHGANFDKTLTADKRGIAHAFQTMCEEHLYWAIVNARWMDRENFEKGPKTYFDDAPAPLRPFVIAAVKRSVKRSMKGQGFGRHTGDEIETLAKRDLDALSAYLADKPFLLGDEPCGADASVWSSVASVLCPFFATPIRDYAEKRPNLVAYRNRGMQRWFPELAAIA